MIRVLLVASLITGISLAPLSCSGGGGIPVPIHDVIDCGKQDAGALGAEFLKLASLIPNWSQIYATAMADKAALGMTGVQIVGCVLADLVQQYLTKKGATATPDETWSASSVLERFRLEAGGASFKVGKAHL